jgi:hypothetical protein
VVGAVALAVGVVLLLAGGVIWGTNALAPGPDVTPSAGPTSAAPSRSSRPPSPSRTAKPSTSSSDPLGGLLGDCPIGAVLGLSPETATLEVQCATQPECFAGITVSSGSASARTVDCDTRHTWETFLTARLPDGVSSADNETVNNNPLVKTLCSTDVLGVIAPDAGGNWRVTALPPTKEEYDQGERRFRCLAGKGLDALSGPHFGTK